MARAALVCAEFLLLLRPYLSSRHVLAGLPAMPRRSTYMSSQVHNDLKPKNILLSERYEVAKIGARGYCA